MVPAIIGVFSCWTYEEFEVSTLMTIMKNHDSLKNSTLLLYVIIPVKENGSIILLTKNLKLSFILVAFVSGIYTYLI